MVAGESKGPDMPTDPRRGATMNPFLIRLARAFAASLFVLVFAGAAVVAAADIGHRDFVDAGASAITGSKPESKLWFNDGFWWASMQPSSGSGFFIYKLNPSTDTWISTGTPLDTRNASHADTLWDGSKLYVASQVYGADGGATGSGSAFAALLYRFSYNSSTDSYTLDGGFPATIRSGLKSETLVIAKDSNGTLWATWTQKGTPTTTNLVKVNHTIGGNDASWSAPVTLPVGGQPVGVTTDNDDIATIIAFSVGGQGRIGVLWSNQADQKDYFAWRADNDNLDTTTWTAETALSGSSQADDHLNIKTDSTGQIYAVVKTSLTGSSPLIRLLRRTTGGSWSAFNVGTGTNSNTRPILELDDAAGVLHVFMTGPQPPATSGQSGGDIYEKTSPTSTISFPTGAGTPVIRDGGASGNKMNNVTSTKQNVNSTSGIVVLAFNDTTDFYWHSRVTPGGGGGAPVADFSANPTSGPPGQAVAFTDLSSNAPNQWAWDFGDPTSGANNTSILQNPSHTYASVGQYTVSLTATNPTGPGSITKTNYITITTGGGGGTPITLTPEADTQVKVGSTTNLGADLQLRTREENPVASSTYRTYLRFNVAGVTGTVNTVTLRLWVNTASSNTQTVLNTTSNPAWPEATTNGTNAPAIGTTVYGSSTASPAGAYKDITLFPLPISGNGPVTLAVKSSSTTSAYYSSKEGAHAPQLVITQSAAGTPPTANAASATITEDVAGPVALGGSDPETCQLTFTLVTAPTKGTVNFAGQSIDPCGGSSGAFTDTTTVTYTPNPNANGSDSFTYKVNDGTADSAPATATLTVTPVEDAPTANGGTTSTPKNTAKTFNIGGSDPETCDLVFTIVTGPANGALSVPSDLPCAAGTPNTDTYQVTYTPATDYTGPDSFTFKVTDGAALDSAPATVNITVTQPNTAPTADPKSPSIIEDTPSSIGLSGSDAENCELTFSIVASPTHGTLGSIGGATCAGTGPYTDSASVTYTPAANYNGGDSFTYKVNDGTVDSSTVTVGITFNPVNDLPVANATSASTAQNTAKVITITGSDFETCDLTFAFTQPGHGVVGSLANNGCTAGNPNTDSATVTYTPTSGYAGPDSFTFTVHDGTVASSSATVTLSVTASSQTITVPVAFDAHVNSANVGVNYGNLTPIRTREDSTGANTYRPYFAFNVPVFSGSASSVKLRLYVTTASAAVTQSVYLVGNGWTEAGINWGNAPVIPTSSIGTGVAGTANAYVEFTLTTPIVSNTTYSFALKSSGSTSVYFNSDDSATNKPQLVIVTGP